MNHRDTAYPGITDRLRHGTEIRVEAEQVDRATEVIEEYIASEAIEGPPIAPPPVAGSSASVRGPGWLIITLILLGLLLLVGYFLNVN